MSSKNNSSSVCPGTVLSVFCLLLYSTGFIRIELKLNDHDQRLLAVEEVISKLKQGMAETQLIKGTAYRHHFTDSIRFILFSSSLYKCLRLCFAQKRCVFLILSTQVEIKYHCCLTIINLCCLNMLLLKTKAT